MSEVYIKAPSTPRNDLPALGLGLLCVVSVFALLPLLMNIPSPWDRPTIEPLKDVSEPLPDMIPITKIQPPPEQQEIEKPDLESPPPPITIGILEALLNPGNNGTGISIDMGGSFVPTNDDIDIFLTGELDKQPRVLVAAKPLYPYSLQQSQTSGSVVVQFVIAPDGKVSRTRITQSSHREFEQPALDSVKRSKWQPGRKDGKDVHSLVSLEINFRP